jgi:hypothetical protein
LRYKEAGRKGVRQRKETKKNVVKSIQEETKCALLNTEYKMHMYCCQTSPLWIFSMSVGPLPEKKIKLDGYNQFFGPCATVPHTTSPTRTHNTHHHYRPSHNTGHHVVVCGGKDCKFRIGGQHEQLVLLASHAQSAHKQRQSLLVAVQQLHGQ